MVWMEYLLMDCLVTITLLLDQVDTNCTKIFTTGNKNHLQWIINDWNNLPQEVIKSDNVWIFKSKLDIYCIATIQIFLYIIYCLRCYN